MPSETQGQSSLILIVDDHQPAAEMASRIFESRGFDVICAYEGHEALRHAYEYLPDLIVLDVMMPGLNGFEVLQQLRENENTANIPTILVTAKDTPDDIEHGLRLGADDYLPKPFDPRELIARAHSKIEARQLRDQLSRRTRELQSLLRVGEELSYSLDVQELERLVLYLTLDLLPGDIAIVYLLDEYGNLVDATVNDKDRIGVDTDYDNDAIYNAIKDWKMAQIWSTLADSPIVNYPFGLIVPMEQLGQVHGFLIIASEANEFDESQMRLLQGIARQASLALRNAELYELKANYAETLEATVADRTSELRKAHEMLVRSEKLASIGRLAAGIAHEINNPLVPVILNLEGMLEDLESGLPVAARDIEHTINSARRIERLIRRLLDFSKRDQKALDGEAVLLHEIINDVIALSHKHFLHSNVEIITDLSNVSPVFGNRDQLEQVFLNIMLNAKEAMPQGGKLYIELVEENGKIMVRFIDTGIGISEEIIDQIFDPFVSEKENGTGLGLFISHEVIENHQGIIEVQSTPNQGARFTIWLPMLELEE